MTHVTPSVYQQNVRAMYSTAYPPNPLTPPPPPPRLNRPARLPPSHLPTCTLRYTIPPVAPVVVAQWAKDYLTEQIAAAASSDGGVATTVTSVSKMEGLVDVLHLRGKARVRRRARLLYALCPASLLLDSMAAYCTVHIFNNPGTPHPTPHTSCAVRCAVLSLLYTDALCGSARPLLPCTCLLAIFV